MKQLTKKQIKIRLRKPLLKAHGDMPAARTSWSSELLLWHQQRSLHILPRQLQTHLVCNLIWLSYYANYAQQHGHISWCHEGNAILFWFNMHNVMVWYCLGREAGKLKCLNYLSEENNKKNPQPNPNRLQCLIQAIVSYQNWDNDVLYSSFADVQDNFTNKSFTCFLLYSCTVCKLHTNYLHFSGARNSLWCCRSEQWVSGSPFRMSCRLVRLQRSHLKSVSAVLSIPQQQMEHLYNYTGHKCT